MCETWKKIIKSHPPENKWLIRQLSCIHHALCTSNLLLTFTRFQIFNMTTFIAWKLSSIVQSLPKSAWKICLEMDPQLEFGRCSILRVSRCIRKRCNSSSTRWSMYETGGSVSSSSVASDPRFHIKPSVTIRCRYRLYLALADIGQMMRVTTMPRYTLPWQLRRGGARSPDFRWDASLSSSSSYLWQERVSISAERLLLGDKPAHCPLPLPTMM